MEHGLKYITFCVQKHIVAPAMGYNPPLVRNKPLGAPAFVKLVYCYALINLSSTKIFTQRILTAHMQQMLWMILYTHDDHFQIFFTFQVLSFYATRPSL